MKNLKKLISLTFAMLMAISVLAACNKTEETGANTPTPTESTSNGGGGDTSTPEPTEEAAPEVVRDLKGQSIIIGNWWEAAEPEPPKTTQEEDTLAYREEFMEKYNFTIKATKLGGWGEYQEVMITSTMAGAPAADVFVMDNGWVAAPLSQGLLYPLNSIESFDFTEEKWNQLVINNMTFNGNIYGMATGRMEPRTGFFFNKRLLEEAGIDPDEPYNLQATDNWTWDTFKDLARRTTRDTNNDGTPDVYGVASFSNDYYKTVVFSNGGEFIGKDENGKLYNATSDSRVLDALNWALSLKTEGYEMPQPEGSNWDWFVPAFKDGLIAFQCAEQHHVSTWADMADDFGFVLFPKGPEGEMRTVFRENIVVMPAGIDAAKVEDVAFAYDLFTNPTPGYEDADFRTNFYPKFRDTRAVDETLTLFYEPKHGADNLLTLVDGINFGEDICWAIDGQSATPAEKLEATKDKWQAFIDAANGL